jgi:transcriptional regulator with XRE-family HTH domain
MDASQAGLARRLRDRRRELGLSQNAVAGDELSPSYVSLLEAGKRVPTAPVLALLAQRLSTTPEYLRDGVDQRVLLERHLALRTAELALLDGRPTDALAALAALTPQLDLDDPLLHEVAWIRARALESEGRLEEAVAGYEQVREQPGRWLWASVALCRTCVDVGDLARAVDVGTAAARRLDVLGLGATDLAAELTAPLLGAYRRLGRRSEAERLATTGAVKAEQGAPVREQAAAYHRASGTARAEGRLDEAFTLAGRAVELYREAAAVSAGTQLRLAHAAVSNPAQARSLVDEAEGLARTTGLLDEQMLAQVEIGRSLLRSGDLAGARALAEKLVVVGAGPAARLLLGQAQTMAGEPDGPETMRDAAREIEQLGSPRAAAEAWRSVGETLREVGDRAGTVAAFQRALGLVGLTSVESGARTTAGV